ncbi:MAG: HDOD domain-containing protein [Gammaproteobacteria bacterium]|nr:HDOD domain-containing protein [Gammaproteobacteria bacterium]
MTMTAIEQCQRHQAQPGSLTSICLKISHLMDDPRNDVNNFISAIRFSPELTSIILNITNNAYAELSGKITSLSRAVDMLGIGQLHYIINSIHSSPELRSSLEQVPAKTVTTNQIIETKRAS